jgi:hypothetical protein
MAYGVLTPPTPWRPFSVAPGCDRSVVSRRAARRSTLWMPVSVIDLADAAAAALSCHPNPSRRLRRPSPRPSVTPRAAPSTISPSPPVSPLAFSGRRRRTRLARCRGGPGGVVVGGPPTTATTVELRWKGSLEKSLNDQLAFAGLADARRAEIVLELLPDRTTEFFTPAGVGSRSKMEAQAEKDGRFVITANRVARLAELAGKTVPELRQAAEDEKRFGHLSDEVDRLLFFGPGQGKSSSDPRGRDKDKGTKLPPFDEKVFANTAAASLYLRLIKEFGAAVVPDELVKKAESNGLVKADIDQVINGDTPRKALTSFFSQGLHEARAAGFGETPATTPEFVAMETTRVRAVRLGEPDRGPQRPALRQQRQARRRHRARVPPRQHPRPATPTR